MAQDNIDEKIERRRFGLLAEMSKSDEAVSLVSTKKELIKTLERRRQEAETKVEELGTKIQEFQSQMKWLEKLRIEERKRVKTLERNIQSWEAEIYTQNQTILELCDENVSISKEHIEQMLECPICYERCAPKKKILQCTSGHILCSRCIPKLRKCPLCSTNLGENVCRNLALENLVSLMDLKSEEEPEEPAPVPPPPTESIMSAMRNLPRYVKFLFLLNVISAAFLLFTTKDRESSFRWEGSLLDDVAQLILDTAVWPVSTVLASWEDVSQAYTVYQRHIVMQLYSRMALIVA